jgi:hypothetical protein
MPYGVVVYRVMMNVMMVGKSILKKIYGDIILIMNYYNILVPKKKINMVANNNNKILYKFGLFLVLCFIQQQLLQQLDMEI